MSWLPSPKNGPRPASRLVAGLVALVSLLAPVSSAADQRGPEPGGRWTVAWSSAMGEGIQANLPAGPYTLRQSVRVTASGPAVRVRLSNVFGDAPVTFGQVTVAHSTGVGSATPVGGTLRRLAFAGSPAVTVPVGRDVTSDPVPLRMVSGGELLVSVYVARPPKLVSTHPQGYQVTWLADRGDHAADPGPGAFTPRRSYYFLTGVDVDADPRLGAVVAMGDSITDGFGATHNRNLRWSDQLADRLRAGPADSRYAVANVGLGGNQLLYYGTATDSGRGTAGVQRLERDVLSRSGVRSLVLFLGFSDLMRVPSPPNERIQDGYRQVVARGHAAGIRVVGATLVPFGAYRKHTPELERRRLALNQWIRTSGVFDAVADFDAVLRDPAAPHRMRAEYDCGDGMHPGNEGYRVMAQAVPVAGL